MSKRTHGAFAGVCSTDVSADVEAPNEATAPRCVHSGSKGQCGPLLCRCKLHLRQVVEEEVEFSRNAAQTGFNQPAQETKGTHVNTGNTETYLQRICRYEAVNVVDLEFVFVYLVKYMVASASDS